MDEALVNLIEEQKHAKTRAENPYKKGTKAYELYEGNPYTREKFTRKKTGWDSFINAWGGRSAYDAALEDWDTRAAEWDAQIVSTNAEDQYNTDSAKAARMREAGLNPDLLGTEGASEAAEYTEPESPDVNAPGDSEEKVFGLVNELGKSVISVLAIGKDVTGVIGMIKENEGKQLDNIGKMAKLVTNYVENYAPDTFNMEGKKGAEKYDWNEAINEMKEGALVWAKENGIPKKYIEDFGDKVRAYAEGHKGEIYKKWTGNLQSKKEFAKTMNNKFTTPSDDVEDVIKVYGKLTNEITEAEKYEIKAVRNLNKYNSDYYANKDGTEIAAGENAEAGAKKEKAGLQQKVRQSIDDATKKLGTLASKGNIFAALLEGIIPGLYLKYME